MSVPLTDLQTRFIAGQIPDWSGYEYLQPTLNKLITHNLLFDFTLPTGYIGAGIDITSGKWVTKAMLAQMNQNANYSAAKGSVLAYRVDYCARRVPGLRLGRRATARRRTSSTLAGQRQRQNSNLGLIEVDGYFIRGDWTVQGQLSYGYQKDAAITPDANGDLQTASWYGLSTLAAYKFTPRFEGIGRFDYINNAQERRRPARLRHPTYRQRHRARRQPRLRQGDGVVDAGCNDGANRYALSVGLNYVFNQYTMFKVEARYDWANQPVFLNVSDGTYSKNNTVLGASVVVSF